MPPPWRSSGCTSISRLAVKKAGVSKALANVEQRWRTSLNTAVSTRCSFMPGPTVPSGAGRLDASSFSEEDTGVKRRDASAASNSCRLPKPYRPIRLQSSPTGSNPKLLFSLSDVMDFGGARETPLPSFTWRKSPHALSIDPFGAV